MLLFVFAINCFEKVLNWLSIISFVQPTPSLFLLDHITKMELNYGDQEQVNRFLVNRITALESKVDTISRFNKNAPKIPNEDDKCWFCNLCVLVVVLLAFLIL